MKFKNPFSKTYSAAELAAFRFLSKIDLFKRLSNEELVNFLPHLHERSFKRDEVVFFRDDPSLALYIIKAGRIHLTIDIEDKLELLKIVEANNAFGDNALLRKTKRVYNAVVASETCIMYVIPQVSIFEIFEKDDAIRAKMMQALAENYNDYTVNLFRAYKASFGFFDLGQAYNPPPDL